MAFHHVRSNLSIAGMCLLILVLVYLASIKSDRARAVRGKPAVVALEIERASNKELFNDEALMPVSASRKQAKVVPKPAVPWSLRVISSAIEVPQYGSVELAIALLPSSEVRIASPSHRSSGVANGQVWLQPVPGSPVELTVRVVDGPFIGVSPRESRRYSVGSKPLKWDFSVIGKEPGRHRVIVEVDATYIEDGKEKVVPLETGFISMQVAPAPKRKDPTTETAWKVGLLGAAMVIAGVVLTHCLTMWRERRKKARTAKAAAKQAGKGKP